MVSGRLPWSPVVSHTVPQYDPTVSQHIPGLVSGRRRKKFKCELRSCFFCFNVFRCLWSPSPVVSRIRGLPFLWYPVLCSDTVVSRCRGIPFPLSPVVSCFRSPIIRHSSSFTVHHSRFIVRRSSFVVHHSSFIFHRPPFTVHRSSVIVHRSSLIVHNSNVISHPPPFIFHGMPVSFRFNLFTYFWRRLIPVDCASINKLFAKSDGEEEIMIFVQN